MATTMRMLMMALLTALLPYQARAANVTVVVRYDDYAARYPGESLEDNDRRLAVDRRVIEAFRRHGLQLTVAVQPYSAGGTLPYSPGPGSRDVYTPHHRVCGTGVWLAPLASDTARVELLKDAIADGTVEVALHGYSHECLVATPRRSEFAGVSQAVQRYRITKGKELLEKWLGCEVRVFIPPYNSYDEITLRILAETGFEVVSADQHGATSQAGLIYLPANATSLEQVRSAVDKAVAREGRALIVVLLHPGDFWDLERLVALDALLSDLQSANHLEVLSLGQCARMYGREHIATMRVHPSYQHP